MVGAIVSRTPIFESLQGNRLNICAIAGRVPNRESNPLLSSSIKGDFEFLRSKRSRAGQVYHLSVNLATIAPNQFGKLQGECVLNACAVNAVSALTFNTPVMKENFSRGPVEIPRANAFDNRFPAFEIGRASCR